MYEISKGTLAVIPVNKEKSLVYEDDDRYLVNQSPFDIMEKSCLYFGSTYEVRKTSARNILGAEYKVPIVVEDSNNIVVFPTNSPNAVDCAWISLKRIKSFNKIDDATTSITFDNDKQIVVPSSFRMIENQVSRASRLALI